MEENGRKPNLASSSNTPLLKINNLNKHFPIRGGWLRRQVGAVRAVDGISFDLFAGETLGLVGGQGSGKSILAKTILHLIKPTSGTVQFDGQAIDQLGKQELRQLRQKMQVIFHDPYLSINAQMRIKDIVGEPLHIHNLGNAATREEAVEELLQLVELNPYVSNRFPYEFTGQMRQRISLARALATQPKLLITDEVTAVLDPVVKQSFINLLRQLQAQFGLAVLYLAGELATPRQICDRVGVLYLGQMVELAETAVLYKRPLHPYTQYLLSLLPVDDPDTEDKRQTITLNGNAPNPAKPPQGCRFHPRCAYASDQCRQQSPELRNLGSANQPHLVACHHAEQFWG
ncbi:MAG: ATP-binding cassette domain-containing protein [Chloroflexi bacterium]|nr:MAG: ATP-binding cassette domain-containing protein [Chloroflexota bacterium]